MQIPTGALLNQQSSSARFDQVLQNQASTNYISQQKSPKNLQNGIKKNKTRFGSE